MCGIVGIVGSAADTRQARAWLEQALEQIAVRGPDGVGIWHEPGVLLGHRRLAIRDLSEAGAQPMHSASGETVTVYNGEIYGTAELADALRARGWSPRGHSDTELLLEHLEAAGLPGGSPDAERAAALAQANGMFALALWHRPTRRLTLARDRVGIKPLYVAPVRDGLAFCSEPGPLYAAPEVDRRLDPEALLLYLALGMVPAPWSLARGVRQLRPGELVQWSAAHGLRHGRFASMPLPARPGEQPSDRVDEAALEQLIERVVADQLVSDVPIGVLLSGGVDSSLVAAAAARAGGRLHTFSVVHTDPAYDEREPARRVASHLGCEHHELEMPAAGLSEQELETLVARTGDPFADSSALPMRRLSALVRQHVTVALSGDGGDELFAGYPRYLLADRLRALRHVPTAVRSAMLRSWCALDPWLGSGRGPGRERLRQVARALQLSLRSPAEQSVGTVSFIWPEESRSLLRPALAHSLDLEDLVVDRLAPPESAPGAWFLHALEQRLVLPDDMLVKVDRMSMSCSLEIRPPLLDDRIVAAAARVSFEDKVAGGEGKAILKRIARRWVPPEVVDRPKQGFAVPLLAYGGPVLEQAGRWALCSDHSPLARIFSDEGRTALARELESPPAGRSPEDSAFRLVHRRWLLVLLARALDALRIELPA